ncbi:MAG: hypothetical protein AAF997_09375, partial [Myxococcota bacterium]
FRVLRLAQSLSSERGLGLDRAHLKMIGGDLSSKPLAALLALEIAMLFRRAPALRAIPIPASRSITFK